MNSTGLEPATEEEMRKALFGTLNKKASGVSGLGPVQLKAMEQNDDFVKYLTQAYNELTAHPEGVRRIPPDRDGETVTNIFHRVLLKGWSGMLTTPHANRSPSSRTRTR